jgi:hypothetical protein
MMATSQKYIRIYPDYLSSFKSRFLRERIGCALFSIRSNIDDNIIYDISYRHHIYLKKRINTEYDLYSIENRDLLCSLNDFLNTIIEYKHLIEYEEYYDDEDPRELILSLQDIEFIQMDLWLEEITELNQLLKHIISSFDYNYQDMKKKGEKFYMELSKYVYKPARIEKIANDYNMEWYTYLDEIDL